MTPTQPTPTDPGRRARPRLAAGFLLGLVLGYLLPAAGLAPPEELYELSAKELARRARVPLPTRWQYHPGDDPAFAAVVVDDGAWEEVDTRLLSDELPENWTGVGWFRLRLRVDPALQGVPLGLELEQLGSAEVYLDGELLYRLGTVAPRSQDARGRVQQRPHLFTFDDRAEHVFAVRYCHHDPTAFEPVGRFGGFEVRIADANRRLAAYVGDLQTLSAYQAFFTGVFACFALLHLLLFIFYPEAAENLYFALLSSTVALLVYLFLELHFTTEPLFFHFYDRAMLTAWLLLCVFALRFAYRVFYPRLPRPFWVVTAAAAALLAPAWIWPLATDQWIFILMLLTSAELVRTVVVALYRRRPGARIVGVGILILAGGFSIGLLANLGAFATSIVTAFLIPFHSVLFLVLTMSIYLSRQFARTNRALRVRLRQVQELSEEKLAQERRAHEEEVRRTLLQAQYEKKSEELEEARKLQLSMLPERLPGLPELEIAAAMETATEVGGDYYDFDVAADGTLTIAIGDATGHGMKAGTLVTATKSLFHTLGQEDDLRSALDGFGRALRRLNLRQLCMALTLARFKAGRLRIAAAGMPPALVYRAASAEVESLLLEGMPLGCLDDFPYQETEVELAPGDTVLLMSDGFPERLNPDDEMLGYDQATAAFSQVAPTSPQAIIEGLVAASEAWAQGQQPADDMTFVVLKMRDPAAPVGSLG